MSPRRGRFEIVRTDAGLHVRIVGANGEPLATSEVLSSKEVAEANIDAIVSVVRDAGIRGVQVRHVDARGATS